MTQELSEKIIEGNKLIAEFMGILTEVKFGDLRTTKHWGDKLIQYHSSWDWLMPVVEKISQYRYPDYYGARGKTEDDGDYDDCAHIRTFGMRDNEGNYMVRINATPLYHAPTLIESTWIAVVEFIKDINEKP